jgi:adenylosuccinate synthase
LNGAVTDTAPLGAEQYQQCEAIIEEMPGWNGTTAGATDFNALPENAKAYIKRIEELVGVKVTILSTGAERDETIVLENPFA